MTTLSPFLGGSKTAAAGRCAPAVVSMRFVPDSSIRDSRSKLHRVHVNEFRSSSNAAADLHKISFLTLPS